MSYSEGALGFLGADLDFETLSKPKVSPVRIAPRAALSDPVDEASEYLTSGPGSWGGIPVIGFPSRTWIRGDEMGVRGPF